MEQEKDQPNHEPHETKDLIVTMDRLIDSVDKLTAVQKKVAKQHRLAPTIIRAIAYALGSTLGLAIVISIIFYILKSVGLFDNLIEILNNLKDLAS